MSPADEFLWIALGFLALAGVALFALWAHLAYWDRRLGVTLAYELEERLATPDGTAIELRRLPPRPAGVVTEALPPVVLVHGLGANHRNNDLDADLSLARHLRAAGRDVWLVTLRSGLSRLTRAEVKLVRFAAMVRHDLPLAIETVLARTESLAVDYVGFSMGGMLLYASLERTVPQTKLRRAVMIGSPALLRPPWPLPRWLVRVPPLFLFTLPLRLFARTGAFASEWVRTPFHRLIFNPDNVAPGIARVALANLVADVPGGLNLDFAVWALSPDGRLMLDGESVVERLADVEVPALFFAGGADRLAPAEAVHAAYAAWGARHPGLEKRFVLLSREAGAHGDYGHGDMALGRHVREDLFEPIVEFLGARV
jgi:poly[(R)-3-hydroxyalkanoate] polymerase subunit PhaC